MTGDNENNRQYRYVTECSECGAMLSTLATSGTRKPGRYIECETDGCEKVNWATDAAEHRPARWDSNGDARGQGGPA